MIIVILLGLALWVVPQVKRLLSPIEGATGLGEALEEHLNPTPTIIPSPITIIRQIRNLSRLETASYTIEKVITAESGQDALGFLFGDRLLLVAHGQVIAGVDLEKMREEDITVSADGQVTIRLPAVEVFVVALDNQKSYVYDRETGLFGLNPTLETAARQAAEQEILNAALSDGILDLANTNASNYIEHLVEALGFEDVVVISSAPLPPPPALSVTVISATAVP
jgi:hypothetical protein